MPEGENRREALQRSVEAYREVVGQKREKRLLGRKKSVEKKTGDG